MAVAPPIDPSLADIEAIRLLKARYFRYVDSKEWAELAGLFTEDATLDGGNGPRRGPGEIVGMIAAVLGPDVVTVHHGHNPEITVEGSAASGIWAMEDVAEWVAQSRERGAPVGFRGYGHYHDRYSKGADGAWRFEEVRLERSRLDPMTGGMPVR